MKKVIPKKKNAFRVLSYEDEFFSMSSPSKSSFSFQFPSFQSSIIIEESLGIGVAGKNIHTGDMLMVHKKDGLIVPFTGPEGRSNV